MKKHYKAVNLPMLDWLLFGGWRSIVVERQALQDLIDIEERMQVLAPIGDDNRRGLWIYVHRGLHRHGIQDRKPWMRVSSSIKRIT